MYKYTGTENLEVMVDATNYNDFLVSIIEKEITPNSIVVDFGAGIGTFAKKIKLLGHLVHCVESDSHQLNQILALDLPASLNLEDFHNNSIDLIYSLNVLEHIENDTAIINDFYNKVKPGGFILIYVPAFNILYSSMDKTVGHVRRYTRSSLEEKVISSGFTVVRNDYVDSLGFFASLLFKLIGNDKGTINRGALIFYDRFIFPLSRLFDIIFRKSFGKNVFLIARHP